MEDELGKSPVVETPVSPTTFSSAAGGNPLLPNGVERSFKSRRTFSKFIIRTRVK